MADHLSIFLENKPGKLEKVTHVLADANINIHFISVASLGEFGVIKTIVDKPDIAHKALKEHHFTVSQKKILIAAIDDRPGNLHELLALFSENDINIEDCYGFPIKEQGKVGIVIEADAYPKIETVLASHHIHCIDLNEIT
ncbi:MAG: hypothetical protein A2Y40_01215 [Candidatus Margulisbacteria bacterium GWF2_35_9]|nr:MAG: hypothetical protein A2Y40_01215 [Candidatus Margulisbacteria bacterium GWF2_35_9]